MAKKEKRSKVLREKMGQMLELPLEFRKDVARITLWGDECVLIENYGGMVEYEMDVIRLVNGICVVGTNFSVEEVTDDELMITGKIKSVTFEK